MPCLRYDNRIQEFRINKQIDAPKLRVIDEAEGNLGVMDLRDALKAAEEKGLDLVLIVPTVSPPIAKITNYDKFRYQKEKEFKKQKQAQKAPDLKQIQISVKEAKNDLLTKVKKLEKFMEAGHKIEIQMTLRGREKFMKDWATMKLKEFLTLISVPYNITQEIKQGGRGMTIQIDKQR